jgi:hypothetical protein
LEEFMLAEARGADLLAQWHANISDPSAKDAFSYIVGLAATHRSLTCFPKVKGVVNDFRFFSKADQQIFSFIVNKGSLLFYFRKPAVRSGRYEFESVARMFASASITKAGEWTVPLQSIDDVKRLWSLLEV